VQAEPLALMVAPLAPHIAQQLWARLGHLDSLAYTCFPEADPELARARSATIAVQVNGRTRLAVEAPAGATAGKIEQPVTADKRYVRQITGLTVDRLVVVPGRIVNVVPSQSERRPPARVSRPAAYVVPRGSWVPIFRRQFNQVRTGAPPGT
jgi:leucyl-tRNA synthetase